MVLDLDLESIGLRSPKQIGLPLGLGLLGPNQIGLLLGLGLLGPNEIGLLLGLGLLAPRPDRTPKSTPLKTGSYLDSDSVRCLDAGREYSNVITRSVTIFLINEPTTTSGVLLKHLY